jgi:phosphate transport system substrate-binding protein
MKTRGMRFRWPWFCAGMVFALLAAATIAGSAALGQDAAGSRLVIEGTGDCQALLRALAAAFERDNPGVRVEVPDTVGSSGGLRALAQGKCDLARIVRPLTDKEKESGLSAAPFVAAPLVFIVNAANTGVKGISAAQAADVYAGRLDSFAALGGPRAKLYPVGREPGDALFAVLKKAVPGFGNGEFGHVKVYYTSQELITDVAAQPLALGYTSLIESAGEKGVAALAFEQAAPTPDNLRSAAYPLRLEFSLAWRKNPSKTAMDFVAFARGEKAAGIIAAMGGTACGDDDRYCR